MEVVTAGGTKLTVPLYHEDYQKRHFFGACPECFKVWPCVTQHSLYVLLTKYFMKLSTSRHYISLKIKSFFGQFCMKRD